MLGCEFFDFSLEPEDFVLQSGWWHRVPLVNFDQSGKFGGGSGSCNEALSGQAPFPEFHL